MKRIIICKECNKEVENQAKGYCKKCYKKHSWKPKNKPCKRCLRVRPNHAKGFCNGCYNSLFFADYASRLEKRKVYGLSDKLYDEITKRCYICGFSSLVDLHHIDKNRKNNNENNLIGLCPNHHRMIHSRKHRKEVNSALRLMGRQVPDFFENDESLKEKGQ